MCRCVCECESPAYIDGQTSSIAVCLRRYAQQTKKLLSSNTTRPCTMRRSNTIDSSSCLRASLFLSSRVAGLQRNSSAKDINSTYPEDGGMNEDPSSLSAAPETTTLNAPGSLTHSSSARRHLQRKKFLTACLSMMRIDLIWQVLITRLQVSI